MTGLLDTICVTPEDPVAKLHHEMTAFIHQDDYLLSAQKMHCIKLFINNVAYTDCLQGFVGELTNQIIQMWQMHNLMESVATILPC